MPAVSEKQKRFMDAAAHSPAFAKKAGIPTSVAKDFSESSKGMKFGRGDVDQPNRQGVNSSKTNHGEKSLFSKGGKTMDKADIKQDKAIVKKAFGMHDKQSHEGKKTDLSKLAKGGMAKGEHPVQKKAKEGAKIVKMARGGGVEVKGKTKGKMIAMCGGGMSKKK